VEDVAILDKALDAERHVEVALQVFGRIAPLDPIVTGMLSPSQRTRSSRDQTSQVVGLPYSIR